MKKTLMTLSILLLPLSVAAKPQTFTAQLSGDQEVPPVLTQARGNLIVKVRKGVLSFKLITANIENVWAAHLHCAPAGANGPVGVTLHSGLIAKVNGILAQGVIGTPDGSNVCGWATADDVIDAIKSGDVYVNVHTLQSRPGEIRGQF